MKKYCSTQGGSYIGQYEKKIKTNITKKAVTQLTRVNPAIITDTPLINNLKHDEGTV